MTSPGDAPDVPDAPAASAPTIGENLWRPIQALLERLGGRWTRLGWPMGALVVVLLLVLKNGITVETFNVRNLYVPGVIAFPEASGYYSASVGDVLLAKVLGATTVNTWVALHVVLVLVALIVAVLLVVRSDLAPPGALLLVLAGSSAATVMVGTVGKYDPLMFLGGVMLVLGRRGIVSYLGAVLMALGNPEQAIVACLCLLILTGIEEFKAWRRVALVSFALTAGIWVVIQLWMAQSGVEGRVTLLPFFLFMSFQHFFLNPTGSICSWLGIGWLVVLGLTVTMRGRARIIMLVSLVLVPMLVTVITADGARVYGLTVLPAFLLAAAAFWSRLSPDRRVFDTAIGAVLVLTIVVPTTLAGWGWLGDTLATPFFVLAERLSEGLG